MSGGYVAPRAVVRFTMMSYDQVLLVTLLAVAFFALAALPAGATVSGTNGKILYGQVFPNYGVTINPDGSNPIPIGPIDNTTCNTWSPDSSKVLCNLWSPDGVPQPATANPDGSGFTLLNPNLPLDLFCLNWSHPTGSRLLCHSEGMANPAAAGLYTVRSSDAAISCGSAPPFPAASMMATATPPTVPGSCTPNSTPTTTQPCSLSSRTAATRFS